MSENTANADSLELAKFDALAGSWWDPEGPLRTLHEINPLRLAYIKARSSLESRRVLDVGCGPCHNRYNLLYLDCGQNGYKILRELDLLFPL